MKYKAKPRVAEEREAILQALGPEAARPPSRLDSARLKLSTDTPRWTELLPSADIGWREDAAIYGLRYSGVIVLSDGQEVGGFFCAFVVYFPGTRCALKLFQYNSEVYSPADADVEEILCEDVDDYVELDSSRPKWKDKETAIWPRIGDEAGEFLFELELPSSRLLDGRFLHGCSAYFFGFDGGSANHCLVAVVQYRK